MVSVLTANNNNREAWIDNVKMIAMLFVILGHTWRVIHCPLPTWLGLFILSFNMALFVVMTGYTSVKSVDNIESLSQLWEYILKITKRILLPSAVFSMAMNVFLGVFKYILTGELSFYHNLCRVLLVITYCIAFKTRNTKRGKNVFIFLCLMTVPLVIYESPFWFFNMIWSVCVSIAVASYVHHLTNRKGGYPAFYALSFLMAIFADFYYLKTSDFVHFFLLGYILKKCAFFERSIKPPMPLACMVIALVLIALLGEAPMNFWDYHFFSFVKAGTLHLYLLRLLSSSLICIFFMAMTRRYSSIYNNFSFWGSQTLAMYLVHGMIVTICYKMPFTYRIEGLLYLLYAIPMTALITMLSIIIIKFFMRYDLTRAYCIGEIR